MTFASHFSTLTVFLRMVSACTIIARNYIAHARVLAESFLAHHPDGNFTVLLIDDESREFDASRESFRCLRLTDIELDRAEIGRLAAIYEVTELATAVKPPFLRHLLTENRTDVLYLDPDIRVYDSLEDVSRLAREHSIVLTPHMTIPVPRDGRRIDEFHILSSGVYNLGFIAVGPGSEVFIDWWWQKTRRDALIDHNRMMFTDQRWVDFVPSFFNHSILKDPGYNVAYWNLHARQVVCENGTYLVDGRPLRFFHFSGFDTRKPFLLSKHQGDRPRILLSEHPVLAQICKEYVECLERSGLPEESALAYGWSNLPSGARLDRRMRRLLREALEDHEQKGGGRPPDPFNAEPEFVEWLKEPVVVGLRRRVPRYLYSVYRDRADLQAAFPDLEGSDCQRYFDWVHGDGVAQEGIPESLLPLENAARDDDAPAGASTSSLTKGVNIAGYFRAELGLGEAARLLSAAVEHAGIPHATIGYDATSSRKAHPFIERGDRSAPHDINIVCVTSDQTPFFAKAAGTRFFQDRHTIGYWFWELDCFPASMHGGFDYVDEVWAATRFVASGIQAAGKKPVYTVPLPVPVAPRTPNVTRGTLQLPDGFMFLFMFDFFSTIERKNPIGVIRAFKQAFRPAERANLVIKTINGDIRVNDLERLRAEADSRPDILIVDAYYSQDEKNAMLGLCDCYVSLHRSEGFGLTMAEAMALEKPVIATGYSGNLDFMTPENSYLVDYTIGSVPADSAPYPEGLRWAEPDLEGAAEFMRRVYEAPDEAARKARTGRQDILTKHTVERTALILGKRLDEIRRARRRIRTDSHEPRRPVDQPVTADHGDRASSDLIDQIESLLTPVASVPSGRRFQRPLLAAQKLLLRLMRPYWWQQRRVQTLLLEGLRRAMQANAEGRAELRAKAAVLGADVALTSQQAGDSERRHQAALESLWTAVRSLQVAREDADKYQSVLEASLKSPSETDAALHRSLESLRDEVQTQISRLQAADTILTGADASMHKSVATFQASATTHLNAITDQLAAVQSSSAALSHRLYAVPYMSDPDRFRYVDSRGNRVLGFQKERAVQGDVYLGFEEIFRGTEAFIGDRFRVYLPLLRNHERVVDIGCGRGELLDLLREAAIPVVGVDVDDSMVRRCRQKGHTVEQTDAISYLKRQTDASLPAIFAAQFVEHLSHDDLLAFLELSTLKLKPGGQLVMETVNPHALEAMKAFWTDLTHQRPIFPEVAVAWCWLFGFEQAYVFFPNGSGELERDLPVQGEYAVVATKGTRRPTQPVS